MPTCESFSLFHCVVNEKIYENTLRLFVFVPTRNPIFTERTQIYLRQKYTRDRNIPDTEIFYGMFNIKLWSFLFFKITNNV